MSTKNCPSYQEIISACGGSEIEAATVILRAWLKRPQKQEFPPDWDWQAIADCYYTSGRGTTIMLIKIMDHLGVDL